MEKRSCTFKKINKRINKQLCIKLVVGIFSLVFLLSFTIRNSKTGDFQNEIIRAEFKYCYYNNISYSSSKNISSFKFPSHEKMLWDIKRITKENYLTAKQIKMFGKYLL